MRADEFLALNPVEKIPGIEDGETIVSEGSTIFISGR